MSTGLQVKYPLFLSDLNETKFSRRIFEKYSNIKFHENPYSGSRVVQCGQTDMTKLIVAFRNFSKAPKNCCGPGSVVGIETGYGLDGLGIESQ
jgi:hypothetical protein